MGKPLYNFFCRTFQTVMWLVGRVLPWREPKIVENIVSTASAAGIRRVLLVTDKKLLELGMTAALEADLSAAGIFCAVFSDVEQNPTIENVEAAVRAYLQNRCEALIALGGGSVMDCAKAAGARIARPKRSVERMAGLLKVMRRLPPLFCVPTTAGTGSEATLAAVITNNATQRKFAINDLSLIPRYAVLDAKLTVGLPPLLTATTGMDALTHAVEAFIGRGGTHRARANAKKAFVLIGQNLPEAFANGGNISARRNMLEAAFCAGCAFTRAYVGNIHAAAHTLGGFYGVPHGLANAVLLPVVLEYYGKAAHKKLAQIARIMGIGQDGSRAGRRSREENARLAGEFISYVREMNRSMGINEKLDCIKDADLPQMVKNALREANPLYPVPQIFTAQDFVNVFNQIRIDAGGAAYGRRD